MNGELAHELLRRIEICDGQMLAQQVAIKALIASHPLPAIAKRAVHAALEERFANGLNKEVNDHVLTGFQRARASML